MQVKVAYPQIKTECRIAPNKKQWRCEIKFCCTGDLFLKGCHTLIHQRSWNIQSTYLVHWNLSSLKAKEKLASDAIVDDLCFVDAETFPEKAIVSWNERYSPRFCFQTLLIQFRLVDRVLAPVVRSERDRTQHETGGGQEDRNRQNWASGRHFQKMISLTFRANLTKSPPGD